MNIILKSIRSIYIAEQFGIITNSSDLLSTVKFLEFLYNDAWATFSVWLFRVDCRKLESDWLLIGSFSEAGIRQERTLSNI